MAIDGWKYSKEKWCKCYVEFCVNSMARKKRMKKNNPDQTNVSNISSTVSNEKTGNVPRKEHLK